MFNHFVVFAAILGAAAALPQMTLEEIDHPASSNSTLCDSVQQYSGYFKLTTGDKVG